MNPRSRQLALELLGWCAVLALVAWPRERAEHARPDPSLVHRLFQPLATLAADVQWIRYDLALRDGRTELAYARAESALELDPGSEAGWSLLAAHQAFERASAEREPDRSKRSAWVRAALETLRLGEASARDPGQLALFEGLIASDKLESDTELTWPGGRSAAWLAAADAFERAASAGYVAGHEFAQKARERASLESH